MRQIGQWVEVQGQECPLAESKVRPPLEQLRSCKRDDEDGPIAGPVEQVLDEVEHAIVGPLEILEGQDGRSALGDALKEGAPRAEELLARLPVGIVDAQQGTQRGLEPAPLLRIGHELLKRGAQLGAR